MKIIRIKQIVILMLTGLFAINAYSLVNILMNKPETMTLELPNSGALNLTQPTTNIENKSETVSQNFDYELIGYRAASNGNSSVVVRKNNKEFVVQIGDVLESQYRLTSVDKDKVVFSSSGKNYEIENRVGK
jgi:type II secretory pathway component PulC